jgi:hypothetical protein
MTSYKCKVYTSTIHHKCITISPSFYSCFTASRMEDMEIMDFIDILTLIDGTA